MGKGVSHPALDNKTLMYAYIYVFNIHAYRRLELSSEAQITANRRNAAHSSGPKTAEGKAAASRNALRHGLTAEQVVLFDEQARDFTQFHDGLRAALDPADAAEEELAERIVLCAWRLRRACRAEASVVNNAASEWRQYGNEPTLGGSFGRVSAEMVTLSRYEAAIDRALRRAHAQLERRQARRRGETVLPPIMVDVEGLDGISDGASPPGKHENCETKPIFPGLQPGGGNGKA